MEYSELIDQAAETADPIQRMVLYLRIKTSYSWTFFISYISYELHCQNEIGAFTTDLQVLIAAFVISPYATFNYRAGTKPFNPLMNETYELIRDDKGWKYIAEQVLIQIHYMYSKTVLCMYMYMYLHISIVGIVVV